MKFSTQEYASRWNKVHKEMEPYCFEVIAKPLSTGLKVKKAVVRLQRYKFTVEVYTVATGKHCRHYHYLPRVNIFLRIINGTIMIAFWCVVKTKILTI